MNDEATPGSKIDRILVGDPIAAGGQTLHPVARVGGWLGAQKGEQGKGLGGLLWIQPLEVRVSGPGGEKTTVFVTDPTGEAARRMALLGLVVAVVSGLLLLASLLRPRS
jgi:hypothetical protein